MNAKWHVLVGCFVAYLFEGMDVVMLAVALPMIIDELQISKSDAGLLFTATLLGVGAAGLVSSRPGNGLVHRHLRPS